MNQNSNLFKLITHGLAFRLKIDIAKKFLKEARTKILGVTKSFIDSVLSDKVFNFCLKAIKGLFIRIKLSPQETYGLLHSSFGELDLPDAADLVDELGMMANEAKLVHYYDNTPFIKEFIDALHDYGQCSFEFGYSSTQRTFGINVYTQGIKELFDTLMQGFI